MAKGVELSSLDLRYEDHRMKNAALEERLLASIAQRGIEEPLEGVQLQDAGILLTSSAIAVRASCNCTACRTPRWETTRSPGS